VTNAATADIPVVRVMGVDPGKATGVAFVDVVHGDPARGPQDYALLRNFSVRFLVAATIGYDDHARSLRTLVQTMKPDGTPFVVVNEKFIVTRLTQQSQDTQSLAVTGALEAVLDLLEVPHGYCQQLPSAAKMLMKDATMTGRLGLSLKGMDGHSRDALRHACTWAVSYVQNKVQLPEPAHWTPQDGSQ
jgi:hypothetical protein